MLAPAQSTEARTIWRFGHDNSQIQFWAKHLGIAVVRAQFASFEGTIIGEVEDPTRSQIHIHVDAGSFTTCNALRDEHLRSEMFFDIERYPSISFTSKTIREVAPNTLKVTGDLSLHGVTREVVLDATINGVVIDPFGQQVAGISAVLTIDRRDFGISANLPFGTGEMALANEVTIEAEIEAPNGGTVYCELCHPEP